MLTLTAQEPKDGRAAAGEAVRAVIHAGEFPLYPETGKDLKEDGLSGSVFRLR